MKIKLYYVTLIGGVAIKWQVSENLQLQVGFMFAIVFLVRKSPTILSFENIIKILLKSQLTIHQALLIKRAQTQNP